MEQHKPFPRDLCHPRDEDPQLELHFNQLYHQEFVPFLRPLSYHDADAIVMTITEMVPEGLRRTVAKNIMESTSISTTEANSLMGLKLEPDWSWNEIYATLETIKEAMTLKIRECLGLVVATNDTAATNNKKMIPFLILGGTSQAGVPIVSTVPLVTPNCYKDRGSVIFVPDYAPKAVKLKELNKYSAADGYDDATLIDDNNLLSEVFLFVSEGICHWSRSSDEYHLIFPLYSVRAMFLHCVEQQRQLVKTAVDNLVTQERVVQYAIDRKSTDLLDRNLPQVIDAVRRNLKQRRITFESHKVQQLEGKAVLVLAGHHHRSSANGICAMRNCQQPTVEDRAKAELLPNQYCREHAFKNGQSEYLEHETRRVAELNYDILTFDSQLDNFSITVRDSLDGADKVLQLERLLAVRAVPTKGKKLKAGEKNVSGATKKAKSIANTDPNDDLSCLKQWTVDKCFNFLNFGDATQKKRAGPFKVAGKAREAVLDHLHALIEKLSSAAEKVSQPVSVENVVLALNLQQQLLQRFYPQLKLVLVRSQNLELINFDAGLLLESLQKNESDLNNRSKGKSNDHASEASVRGNDNNSANTGNNNSEPEDPIWEWFRSTHQI
jgi:hypothetical protein